MYTHAAHIQATQANLQVHALVVSGIYFTTADSPDQVGSISASTPHTCSCLVVPFTSGHSVPGRDGRHNKAHTQITHMPSGWQPKHALDGRHGDICICLCELPTPRAQHELAGHHDGARVGLCSSADPELFLAIRADPLTSAPLCLWCCTTTTSSQHSSKHALLAAQPVPPSHNLSPVAPGLWWWHSIKAVRIIF